MVQHTPQEQQRRKRVWITVSLLAVTVLSIYLAFIGRGVFGWFA